MFESLRVTLRAWGGKNYTCDICGREVFSGERVCEACRAALPAIALCCPLCGRRVKEAGICLECKRSPLTVDTARSGYTHEGEAARLVVRFKRGSKYLYRTLAELSLPRFLEAFPQADALCYIPMTPAAEKKRGYNQARLFAEELSRRTGLPVIHAEKTRETGAQKELGRDARQENLKNAYRLTEKGAAKGKCVVIVDDTMTTGATVCEMGRVLRKAGAARVCAFTFTSVEDKHPFGLSE